MKTPQLPEVNWAQLYGQLSEAVHNAGFGVRQHNGYVSLLPRTGSRLTRYPPSERQAGWWYCSPEASTVGPFATEAAMEADIFQHYFEP